MVLSRPSLIISSIKARISGFLLVLSVAPQSFSWNILLSDITTRNFSNKTFDDSNRFTVTVFVPCEIKSGSQEYIFSVRAAPYSVTSNDE